MESEYDLRDGSDEREEEDFDDLLDGGGERAEESADDL
jgi:hypothetical protein